MISLQFTFRLVYIGMRLNKESMIQTDVLLEYSRQVERRLAQSRAKLDSIEMHELQVSSLTLQSAREQLRIDMDLRPFRVMGMPANTVIVKVFISILISYILALLRLAYNNK